MHSFNNNNGTITRNKTLFLVPWEKQREKTQHQRTGVEKLNTHIINSKQCPKMIQKVLQKMTNTQYKLSGFPKGGKKNQLVIAFFSLL